VGRKETKANPDTFRKREEKCWTIEEEVGREMRWEQAGGLGHEVK
jgi:hypothetical protein